MKKTYIYLALGAAVAWWFIRRKKDQAPAEERTLVLLELGIKNGDTTPARLTYSDGTKQVVTYNSAEVLAAMKYAESNGIEVKTDVKDIIKSLFDGGKRG